MTAAAAAVVARLSRVAPTLSGARLLCLDGPAGSGKTTLAAAVRAAWGEKRPGEQVLVVGMDDLYPGWDGLEEGVRRVRSDLVTPLLHEEPAGYRRYDWLRGSEAEWVRVPPVDLLVLEGCGAGSASYAAAITMLVWVEAPAEVRLHRGLARDGDHLRAEWLAWAAQEERLFATERTRERADLVVASGRVSAPSGSPAPG